MKQTYIASAMIHAMSMVKGIFGRAPELNKIHTYEHPFAPGKKRTGNAAARRAAKKTRNIRARASK